MSQFHRTKHINEETFQNNLVLRYPELSDSIVNSWNIQNLSVTEYDDMVVFFYSLKEQERELVSSIRR
jgi:hypothetical protein